MLVLATGGALVPGSWCCRRCTGSHVTPPPHCAVSAHDHDGVRTTKVCVAYRKLFYTGYVHIAGAVVGVQRGEELQGGS